MRKTMKNLQGICLLALAAFFMGCSNEDCPQQPEQPATGPFELSSESIQITGELDEITTNVGADGKTFHIEVKTSDEMKWNVALESGSEFTTVTPTGEQTGLKDIEITIAGNESEEEREARVKVNCSETKTEKTFIFTQEGVINGDFHFAVIGDTHYGQTGKGGDAPGRLTRSFKALFKKQPGIKALLICGDVTDSGTETQWENAVTLIENLVPDGVKVVYMMGNHDNAQGEASAKAYTDATGQDFYQYMEMEGFPFITISVKPTSAWSPDYTEEAVEFLRNNLEKAAKDYPGSPIFVFSHSPSTKTPWGTKWGYDTMNEVLAQYPQVIHFTGHTHYTIEDERSIWQDQYTWVNVGPSHYANISLDITPDTNYSGNYYPASGNDITEGLIVTVDKATNVEITRMDTWTDRELKQPWIIKVPHNGSQFRYTFPMSERQDKTAAPTMTSEINVENISELGCDVSFEQGTDDEFVWHYILEAINQETNEADFECKMFSDFYWRHNGQPTTLTYNVTGLKPTTRYKIRVKAVDSFMSESAPAESQEFSTKEVTIDPDVPAPTADLLDIEFKENGEAENKAASGLTISKGGTPTTQQNSELGMWTVKCSDTENVFYTDWSSNSTYQNTVSEGFSYEVYVKSTDTSVSQGQYALSNLQGAGMGIVFNETYTAPSGKTWAAMIHDGNKYHKLSFDATEENTWYHLVLTWDKAEGIMKIYKDGYLVASETCTDISLPRNNAKYIVIGADSNYINSTLATTPLHGEIAVARIYGKAINASEVHKLYEELTGSSE